MDSVLPGVNKLRGPSPGALAVAKDKRYAVAVAVPTHKLCGPSPGVLAVAKDKRYALSGPSPGCANRRQRQRQHEVKTESCALHWSRPFPNYLGLTNCAGRHQVRWPSPKIKDTRSRSPHKWCGPSPGALAVAKDKRYTLSGPSPGCADRRQRQRQHEVKDRKLRAPLVLSIIWS